MMLLGGGTAGDERVVELCSRDIPKSVVGYVSTVITNGRGAKLPNLNDFLIHVSDYNKGAPSNMYLLCGDGNMDLWHLQLMKQHQQGHLHQTYSLGNG
jgi:hypothetical protein